MKGPTRDGETDANGYLLARPASNGQILVFGDDEHAVYHFTPDKRGQHAQDFLVVGTDANGQPIPWRGTITADALSAQDCLFDVNGRIESGCNSHYPESVVMRSWLRNPTKPLGNESAFSV